MPHFMKDGDTNLAPKSVDTDSLDGIHGKLDWISNKLHEIVTLLQTPTVPTVPTPVVEPAPVFAPQPPATNDYVAPGAEPFAAPEAQPHINDYVAPETQPVVPPIDEPAVITPAPVVPQEELFG